MSLGGGTWIAQNKKLPGAYINVVGKPKTQGLSDRGIVAVALDLPWGEIGKVISVSKDSFFSSSRKLFGCAYEADEMLPLRELFCHAEKALVYRLGTGGSAASNTFATAKYVGTAGNKIITTIKATTDGEGQTGWIVRTYFDGEVIDEQTAGTTDKTNVLVDNDYVTWNKDVTLEDTTKITGAMSGGENPDSSNTHGAFLSAIQTKNFNVLVCSSTSALIASEYKALIENMRDSYGIKCQAVVYKFEADYEGIINAVNEIEGEADESGNAVYWIAGAEATCAVNKSCTNMVYDGELNIKVDYGQDELETAFDKGHLIMHTVNDDVRILEDINSLVTLSETKTEDFRYNQTIRVLDQIANDVALLYNTRYIGTVPNDSAGRDDLWNNIVTKLNTLQNMRAIENFEADHVEVLPGEQKKAVVVNLIVTPVNAMAQLYMTVYAA